MTQSIWLAHWLKRFEGIGLGLLTGSSEGFFKEEVGCFFKERWKEQTKQIEPRQEDIMTNKLRTLRNERKLRENKEN